MNLEVTTKVVNEVTIIDEIANSEEKQEMHWILRNRMSHEQKLNLRSENVAWNYQNALSKYIPQCKNRKRFIL